jgi:HEAT repeat protein
MLRLVPLTRTLAAALRDSVHTKPSVRVSAARDLGRLARGDERPQCITVLVRLLEHDGEALVRAEAAVALADAEASESVPALLRAFDDESVRVREMALLALGEVGSGAAPDVEPALRRALVERSPALRFQGLIAGHRLLKEQVLPELLAATRDADDDIRYIAWRLLEEGLHARSDGVGGDDLVLRARRALSDPALSVRLVAAFVLGRCGVREGGRVVAEALNGHQALSPDDEQEAIEYAGEFGITLSRPGLERRARGGWLVGQPFAWQARVALARLGDEEARRAIVRALGAWSRDTRTLAVVAVGRARLTEARRLLEAMRADPTQADPEVVDEALASLAEQPSVATPEAGRRGQDALSVEHGSRSSAGRGLVARGRID